MNTGGSAFPVHPNVNLDLDKRWCGMTLRDYFAAKAMQGLLASPHASQDWINNHLANSAWQAADAMLKARET